MTDPMPFASTTARFGLPLLYAGQAHKEVFVNEALFMTDALMHCIIYGENVTPPQNPTEGQAWLVGQGAAAEWAGHDGEIALARGGSWAFAVPGNGLRVLDVSTCREMLFLNGWRKGSKPMEPVGGSIVDGEARAAINDLVSALQALGILPTA